LLDSLLQEILASSPVRTYIPLQVSSSRQAEV